MAYWLENYDDGINIDEYVRIMFVKNTEDDLDFHENYIQPIWCDNIYQDDAAWKQLGNITSHLVCPNTTEISFKNDA